MTATENLLEVSDLGVSFLSDRSWKTVVQGVDFSVRHGETVAIVGESGSGKSVTAMAIMGLLPRQGARTTGSVIFSGRSLGVCTSREMRDVRGKEISMIFQEPMTSLNPTMSIGDQIAEVLVRHEGLSYRSARVAVLALLERVKIPAAKKRIDEYPHNFSGGMRQRVMIAIALACKPKLLIADEPTTALDVTIQRQILQLIRELQEEERMAVMFITHDMGVVAEVADRMVVMYNGGIVEQGAASEVFFQPKAAYTRKLLAAVAPLDSSRFLLRPVRFAEYGGSGNIERPEAEQPDTVDHAAVPVLSVEDLTTRFDVVGKLFNRVVGRVHAVEKVSFSILPGETLSLVGESGCGKSTTGRSILRLLQPTAGKVRVNGRDMGSLDPKELRRQRQQIQMVFQDPFASLNPRFRIGAAIAEPMLCAGMDAKAAQSRVLELLGLVGLSAEMAGRYPHEFSGGQRQRICIARALSVSPRILIADEAVSALDVSVKAQIVNLLLDLQQQLKLSYLFISHDMAVVERVSHRIAVMYLGEIVEIGTRSDIMNNARHSYTRRLLKAVPVADPSRRGHWKPVEVVEIRNPIRDVDYVAPSREYVKVNDHHYVMADAEA